MQLTSSRLQMANYVLYKLITIKNRNSVTKATTNEIVLQGHVTYNNQSNR